MRIYKKNLFILALIAMVFCAEAQIKQDNNGKVTIGTLSSNTVKLECRGGLLFTKWNAGWENININWDNVYGAAQMYCTSGNFYVGTPTYYVGTAHIRSLHYQSIYNHSDERLKQNIRPINSSLERLLRVNGKSFNYIDNFEDIVITSLKERLLSTTFGFIAQELKEVFPELVCDPDDLDEYYSVNYVGLIPVLVESIKEQQSIIVNLQQEVEFLKNKLIDGGGFPPYYQQQIYNEPPTENVQNNFVTEPPANYSEGMTVYQNAPNPFNTNTAVKCFIPKSINKVQLCIYNVQGVQVKCIEVLERGNTTVQIEARQLPAGIYTYLLTGDGKTSDAKQMILTK